MGGRGSGGARVGAGRKSKRPPSSRGRCNTAPSMPHAEPFEVELAPPVTLSPAEHAVWVALAPHARRAGTLEPSTAADFAVLVSLVVEARELLEARRAAGWSDRGFTLATHYRQVVQRLEAKMRGFLLSPIGKPIRPPVVAPDEFAEFDVPVADACQSVANLLTGTGWPDLIASDMLYVGLHARAIGRQRARGTDVIAAQGTLQGVAARNSRGGSTRRRRGRSLTWTAALEGRPRPASGQAQTIVEQLPWQHVPRHRAGTSRSVDRLRQDFRR